MRRELQAQGNSSESVPRRRYADPSVGLLLDAAQEAARVLEQEGRAHPTYADVRHRLGLLRLLRRDPQGGEREFEEAMGINPGYRAAYYGLRLARMVQGLPVEELRNPDSRSVTPPEEAAWRRIDQAYQRLGGGQDPLEVLKPGDDRADSLLCYHYAGFFSFGAGESATARRHLEKAAGMSLVTRRALERLGVLPWNEQDLSGIADGLGLLLWSPLAEDLYTYLAHIYARNGLREEAMECCERAYLVLPRDAQNAMYRAEIAMAFGEEQESIQLLTQAIEADPTSVPARIALAFENASQGFLDEARTQFQVAANLAPGYADVRYNLGLLYVGEGRSEEALAEFRRALALNPSYLPARHSMSHLLCRLGQYDEGLREYARIRKQGFESSDMLVQMGKAALALDRNDEALGYLERAIYLNPEFSPSYYYLGQAYQRSGFKNKARSAWRTYLEKANEWEPLGPVPVDPDTQDDRD
jgi:tetratricopeptide (TPR) repeat protein